MIIEREQEMTGERTWIFYRIRLEKYYAKKYGKYDDEIEWFPNPTYHSWLFRIPSLNRTVELNCDFDGNVKETIK